MTIEHYRFAAGYPLGDDPRQVFVALNKAIAAHSEEGNSREILSEGIHGITPPSWRGHLSEHFVEVHPDGTGTYCTYPRDDHAAYRFSDGRPTQRGGVTVLLPQEQPFVAITALMPSRPPERPLLGIFELVIYRRGLNPPRRA